MRLVPLLLAVCVLGLPIPARAEEDDPIAPALLLMRTEANDDVDFESKSSEPEVAQPFPIPANGEVVIRKLTPEFLDCRRFNVDLKHCERLNRARAEIAEVTLGPPFNLHVGPRRMTEAYRPIAAWVYDSVEEKRHIITLAMPVTFRGWAVQPFILDAPDSTCQAKRPRGYYVSKLVAEVYCFGRQFPVYATKQWVFWEDRDGLWPREKPIARSEVAVYLVPPTHLARSEELARYGDHVLDTIVQPALERLTALGVRSRAYPERLVGQTISSKFLKAFLIAEQQDLCFVPKRPSGCESPVPIPPYQDEGEVRRAVRIEVALNGLDAFRYAVSSAKAHAAFQFMPDTYKSIVIHKYPEAKLEPNYRRGTADIINHAMAAALLHDANLSDRKGVRDWVRAAFLVDQRMGAPSLGGYYNAGPRRGGAVTGLMETLAKRLKKSPEQLRFTDLLGPDFRQLVEGSGSALKPETRNYVFKLLEIGRELWR